VAEFITGIIGYKVNNARRESCNFRINAANFRQNYTTKSANLQQKRLWTVCSEFQSCP